jgi:hypothetical protein
MSASQEIQNRKSKLEHTLTDGISKYRTLGMVNSWVNFVLMLVILLASAVAAIGGISKAFNSTTTGILALVPGIVALFATTLKFQTKSSWHYRKKDELEGLLNRLNFQLPENPTADNIAAIGKELDVLNKEMTKEWDKDCSFDFAYYRQTKSER